MDIRFHFDRPVSPLELQVENNASCVLSGLGQALRKIRLNNNGRYILLSANSNVRRPTKKEDVGSFRGTHCVKFDLEKFEHLNLDSQKQYLLNWCLENVETALENFLPDGLNAEISETLQTFRESCDFASRFNGKWTQIGNQRARAVVFQRFEQADVHIESKIYRSRTSDLSPILLQTLPSVFIFQKHLQVPIQNDKGLWVLAR